MDDEITNIKNMLDNREIGALTVSFCFFSRVSEEERSVATTFGIDDERIYTP